MGSYGKMKALSLFLLAVDLAPSLGWVSTRPGYPLRSFFFARSRAETVAFLSDESKSDDVEFLPASEDTKFKNEAARKEAVGNLVADDEWMGITMELSEIVRMSVLEDLKKKGRDFLGKDEYKVGDISKELDSRVKDEVAKLRGKDEYELGDFVLAIDEASKQMTEELTGKPYEAGDLSKELDTRIKSAVATYAGKDEYEFGDLAATVTKRIQERVEGFTGKEYEFGDISRQINENRKQWVKDFLGEEAAKNYEFGDITKKALSKFTGKDEYQFGDVSKKIFGDLFGKRKRGGKEE